MKALAFFILLNLTFTIAEAKENESISGAERLVSYIDAATQKLNCEITVNREALDIGQGEVIPALVFEIKRQGMRDLRATAVGPVNAILTRYKSSLDGQFKYLQLYRLPLIDSLNPGLPDRLDVLVKAGEIQEIKHYRATAYLDGKGPSYDSGFDVCLRK